MNALAFRVYGVAQGMGSKRAFVPKGWTRPIITDTNRSLKAWQSLVAEAAGRAIHERTDEGRSPWTFLEGPIRLSLAFYFPRPKSLPKRVVANTKVVDVDKCARAIGDALSGVGTWTIGRSSSSSRGTTRRRRGCRTWTCASKRRWGWGRASGPPCRRRSSIGHSSDKESEPC